MTDAHTAYLAACKRRDAAREALKKAVMALSEAEREWDDAEFSVQCAFDELASSAYGPSA